MFDDVKRAKIEAMGRYYPALRLVSRPEDDLLVWEGALRPLRFSDELDAILHDLEGDRPVFIVDGELHEIRHDPECRIEHGVHRLTNQIDLPTRSFTVRVTDFGDHRLPQTIVLEPAIPDSLRVHFFGEGICAYAPWKYPRDEGIVSFVDHSLICLFKWNVFSQTDPRVWIGSETDHKPSYVLNEIKPKEPCFCSSGKDFQDCCRSRTAALVFGKAWIEFERWLRRHNSNPRRFEHLVHRVRTFRPKRYANAAGNQL